MGTLAVVRRRFKFTGSTIKSVPATVRSCPKTPRGVWATGSKTVSVTASPRRRARMRRSSCSARSSATLGRSVSVFSRAWADSSKPRSAAKGAKILALSPGSSWGAWTGPFFYRKYRNTRSFSVSSYLAVPLYGGGPLQKVVSL